MTEAGALVRRREPPLRMLIDPEEPSILARRSDPCRLLPFRGDSGSARCRDALLKRQRQPCCPGLRKGSGTGPRIRLRRRRPRALRRLG